MADEDLSLNEDQLLDSLDDANGDSELMQDVSGGLFVKLATGIINHPFSGRSQQPNRPGT